MICGVGVLGTGEAILSERRRWHWWWFNIQEKGVVVVIEVEDLDLDWEDIEGNRKTLRKEK